MRNHHRFTLWSHSFSSSKHRKVSMPFRVLTVSSALEWKSHSKQKSAVKQLYMKVGPGYYWTITTSCSNHIRWWSIHHFEKLARIYYHVCLLYGRTPLMYYETPHSIAMINCFMRRKSFFFQVEIFHFLWLLFLPTSEAVMQLPSKNIRDIPKT